MQCPQCQTDNADGARFCTECGALLAVSGQEPFAQRQGDAPPFIKEPNAPKTTQAPTHKKHGKTVIITFIVIAVIVIGGVSLKKLFRDKEPPTGAVTDETATQANMSGNTEEVTATTNADPVQTTVSTMQGAAERDFSILYGEWVDPGDRYDLYIRPDGSFSFALPEGICTGHLEIAGPEGYLLIARENPGLLPNAVISIMSEAGVECLRLRTDDAEVDLNFIQVPEKSEIFDWILLDYADRYLSYYDSYEVCRIDRTEYTNELIMIANYPLRDVRILSLEIADVTQDGRLLFNTEELYAVPALLSRHPLLLEIANGGDMPTRGVSFTDLDGVTHYFSISYSGYDGSVLFTEFDPF